MIKHNLDKLVRVQVNDFYKSGFYEWRPEKRFLGLITQKEGIYDSVFNTFEGSSHDTEEFVLKDNILYEKPEVTLYFVDKDQVKKKFDSYEEAKEYASKFTVGENWHKL